MENTYRLKFFLTLLRRIKFLKPFKNFSTKMSSIGPTFGFMSCYQSDVMRNAFNAGQNMTGCKRHGEEVVLWTAGHQLAHGQFVWKVNPIFSRNHTGHSIKYTNWLSGEPSDENRNRYCIGLWTQKNFGWNGLRCWSEACFVCELHESRRLA